MVALLVGLRWRQFRHQLSRNPWMFVTLIIMGMLALGFLALLAAGLLALRIFAPNDAVTAVVLAGSVIVLAWWIGSILISADDSLAPERFALLPVTARALLPGFVVAGVTTVGGIGTTFALLLMLVGWSVSMPALLAALILIPLAVATCVLGARVVSGLLGRWLARRSTRDLVLTVGVLLVASSGLIINLGIGALSTVSDANGAFAAASDIAGWTPVGAVFGVSASLAHGDFLSAALRIVIALATVVVLWFTAQRLLDARLVAPIQSSGGGRVRSGKILDRMLPAGPVGAIAARTLRFFRRDPRHLVNIAMLVVLPGLFLALSLMNGIETVGFDFSAAIILIPTVNALLTGTIMQMMIAYDNDAVAMHILSGVSGAADRAGRLLGFGVIAVPVTVAMCVASCFVAGRPDLLPASLGSALGLSAIAAGAGAWVGGFLPGQAPAPEASPFGRGSSGGIQTFLAMIIVGPITLVLGAPAFGFAIAAIWFPALGWVSLACGVIVGAGALWAGTALGGRLLDRRWPEVLAAVSSES